MKILAPLLRHEVDLKAKINVEQEVDLQDNTTDTNPFDLINNNSDLQIYGSCQEQYG